MTTRALAQRIPLVRTEESRRDCGTYQVGRQAPNVGVRERCLYEVEVFAYRVVTCSVTDNPTCGLRRTRRSRLAHGYGIADHGPCHKVCCSLMNSPLKRSLESLRLSHLARGRRPRAFELLVL